MLTALDKWQETLNKLAKRYGISEIVALKAPERSTNDYFDDDPEETTSPYLVRWRITRQGKNIDNVMVELLGRPKKRG